MKTTKRKQRKRRSMRPRSLLRKALKESEERYRLITENMPGSVWLMDMSLKPTYISPNNVRVRGYTLEELYTLPLDRQLTPDSLRLALENFKKALSEEKLNLKHTPRTPVTEELEWYRKDGSTFWSENTFSFVRNSKGEPTGILGVGRDITERKRLEENLRQYSEHLEELVEAKTADLTASARKYQLLVDNMADAVFTIDLKGNLTFLSPQTGKMTGYSIKQLLSMNIKELIAPEDLPEVLKRLETRSRGVSGLLPMQFELVRADGTRFPIEVHTNLLCEGNKPVGVQGVARDITERKRMEDALRNSEARFREMANLLPQIVFEIDSKGNYTFVNRSGIASVGYTEEEILSGLNALQTFIEPDRARIKKNIGRALAGEELATTEYTALRKDGTTFPVIIHSTPIIHEGKPVGLRGIAMDITERKRMEEALRESERRFREMTDMLPETVLEQDLNGNYTFMNPAGLKAIGYDEGDLKKGLNAFQVVAPEDHDALREGIRRILNGAPSKGLELTIVRKDGSRFPEIAYASPIIKEGKPVGLRAVVVDITERKRLEERLAEAKRFAAIGETAAMVGHDLRNPLQGIAGALELLKQESLTAEERKEMLQVIEESVHYSDAIIKDLSDYSAEINLRLVEATPKSITKDAIETVKVPQNVRVQDLSEDQPTLKVDPNMMKRAFINLIENAIDAMPQGGTLTVSSKKSYANVQITLRDTGSGMSKKVMENLWKPLQTTKAKGLGLGLAICKRIVDAHGGSISVKSEVGRGTTFTIQLPTRPVEVKQT